MLGTVTLLFCRLIVAFVFALSASGKALDIRAFQAAILDFRLLPARWTKAAAWAFLSLEFAVVLLMLVGGSFLWTGFSLAVGLLAAFSFALVIALRRDSGTVCNCFGKTEQRISPYDLARNVLLILCSLVGILVLHRPNQHLSVIETVMVGLVVLCYATLIINLRDVVETLRRPLSIAND